MAQTRLTDRLYGPQFEDQFGPCLLAPPGRGSNPQRIFGCAKNRGVVKFVKYIADKKCNGSIPGALDYLGQIGIKLAPLFISKGAWQLHHGTRPISSARGFSTGVYQAPERLRQAIRLLF